MKKVLVLDRGYSFNYMKSDKFEVICLALSVEGKKYWEERNIKVVGCFEEEYKNIEGVKIPDNYLLTSWDSDRFLNRRFNFEERRCVLGKEIAFVSRILDEYKPALILNEVVTIEFMEVLYIEALKRNIPYKTWMIFPSVHKDLWASTPFNSLPTKDVLNAIPKNVDYEAAREFVDRIKNKHDKPFYINVKYPSNLKNILVSTKSYCASCFRNFCKQIHGYFNYENYSSLYKNNLKAALGLMFHSYDSYQSLNSNYEYVFFPLHMEPEAAISYTGECYGDQEMLISRISHSLGTNQKLIVKEHPQQRGVLLTKKYQDLKKKCCNLIYIDAQVSSYDIFKKMICMVTLNGTAGFEALICGKPVILFGNAYYKECKSSTFCDSFWKLKEMLREHSYNIPNEDDLIEFIAKMLTGMTDTFPYLMGDSYNQNDVDNITKQIEEFIFGKNEN